MLKNIVLLVTCLILTHLGLASEIILLPNPYQITSLRLTTEFYQEHQAHPSLSIESINVDAKKQQILKLSNIFIHQEKALKIAAAYSQAYFIKMLTEENLPKNNFDMRANFIKTGTSPLSEHYRHWNVHADYLEITFDRAQIAPSYYGPQVVDIPLILLADLLNPALFPQHIKLKAGDLLFQDLACGELCEGINSTTYGYKSTIVSHVGMLVSLHHSAPMVIEAVSTGVKLTPLNEFLVRSEDSFGHPRVMLGRVDDRTKPLISDAIKNARQHLHAPYNATFAPDGSGFYCSQLITQSFFEANHQKTIFASHPMNFKTEHPNAFSPAWIRYFSELKQPIPQGKLGNNPGMLSRDPHVRIMYFFGDLRQRFAQ